VTDTVAPTISLGSFTSNFGNGLVWQGGSRLTLSFTVDDDYDLPSQSGGTVPGLVVSIGSALGEFVSSTSTTGKPRTFQFGWTVPASPSFTTVGFQVTVVDTAGNSKTLSADGWLTSGKDCTLC